MDLVQQDGKKIVKAEGNFEDLPYFTVGNTRRSDGVIEYRGEILSGDGQVLRQSWTVRAMSGYGLPGSLDQDVYVALLQIIEREAEIPADRWISFSLYEMVELLSRSHGGRDYQQVKQSLDRLAGTRIQSKNAFYRKDSKTFMDGTFGLLDRVQHSETVDKAGRRSEKTSVQLSEYFVTSYRSDYLKGLDADFYYSLSSAVAKRLYRFVDKKRNHKRQWQTDLFSLRDRIPLSDYRYASKIKEKLAPAHAELVEKGFLESVSYSKNQAKVCLATYRIREEFSRRRPAIHLDRTPENLIAVERLKAENVWTDVAENLVASYGPARCTHFCETLHHQKNVRNRPAWLRWAITEGPDDLELPAPGTPEPSPKTSELFTHNTLEDELSLGLGEDPVAAGVWEGVLRQVLEGLGSASSVAWFDGSVPVSLEEDERLTVVVPNDLARDYIESRFGTELLACLRADLGPKASLLLKSRAEPSPGERSA